MHGLRDEKAYWPHHSPIIVPFFCLFTTSNNTFFIAVSFIASKKQRQ